MVKSMQALRLKAGLTQSMAAKSLGVRQSTISMWETGSVLPRADKLPQLAVLYGCTIDELLREDPDNESITHGEVG